MKPLPRSFYDRDVLEVAPELLHRILAVPDGRSGRIVEVEAYRGADDPAAHSFRGRTKRNATMFGPPGHLYVYFSYGVHWCANATCGHGSGVLLRAIEPLTGVEAMRKARSGVRDRDLANGPGKLTKALGIDGMFDGADLVAADRVGIFADAYVHPYPHLATPRVGISKAAERPWRWVPGAPRDR